MNWKRVGMLLVVWGDINVNGAPNIIDYIDLTALGGALSDSWDESANHRFSDDSVITTSYGW